MFGAPNYFLTRPVSGGIPISSYQIPRSLYSFLGYDTLTRTPATATNGKTFTISMWLKPNYKSGTLYQADSVSVSNPFFEFSYGGTTSITYDIYHGTTSVSSALLMNDTNAWQNIVLVVDTTQATSTNRIKLYVNGSQITLTGTFPTLNYVTKVNQNVLQAVGNIGGIVTEVYLIDGQALTQSSFGQTISGIWFPKAYTGTYGTNGFYLNFSNYSTVAGFGTDSSGNGNTFTVGTGIAITDGLTDTPTAYNSGHGNYANYSNNHAYPFVSGSTFLINSPVTYNNYVSYVSNPGADFCQIALGTMAVSSGKWVWEVTYVSSGTAGMVIGICLANADPLWNIPTVYSQVSALAYRNNGQKYDGTTSSSYGSSYTTGNIIGVALDLDAGTLTFYKNGVSQGVAFSGISGAYIPMTGQFTYSSSQSYNTINFGQVSGGLTYSYPGTYLYLNTYNLPTYSIITSGTFVGNASKSGPFIYLNGVPLTMTINGNAVTFGTHAIRTANGFKVITDSVSYNAVATNTYSITLAGDNFKNALGQLSP